MWGREQSCNPNYSFGNNEREHSEHISETPCRLHSNKQTFYHDVMVYLIVAKLYTPINKATYCTREWRVNFALSNRDMMGQQTKIARDVDWNNEHNTNICNQSVLHRSTRPLDCHTLNNGSQMTVSRRDLTSRFLMYVSEVVARTFSTIAVTR